MSLRACILGRYWVWMQSFPSYGRASTEHGILVDIYTSKKAVQTSHFRHQNLLLIACVYYIKRRLLSRLSQLWTVSHPGSWYEVWPGQATPVREESVTDWYPPSYARLDLILRNQVVGCLFVFASAPSGLSSRIASEQSSRHSGSSRHSSLHLSCACDELLSGLCPQGGSETTGKRGTGHITY